MNAKRLLLAAALIPGLAGITGCETMPFQKKDNSVPGVESDGSSASIIQGSEPMEPLDPIATGLPLATTQRFPDLPLPLGVKEDLDRTYVFESSGFRVGRMVYNTRDAVADVAQFYIRECPIADWKLNSAVQAEGVQLQFLKGGEKLDVNVRGGSVSKGTELILHLTPSEGASAPL
jgi:hypothetical protein